MATSEVKTEGPTEPAGSIRQPENTGSRAGADLQVGHREDRGHRADADTPLGWFALFSVGGAVATLLLVAVTWLFLKGVGIWAITQPVAWGFAIINFVWWIGIGHAGTLISAILLLFKQGWRNSINRFRRGHDDLRRGLRRHVPADSRGPSVAGLLAAAAIPTR
jgi:hypothetical protein